MQEINSKPSSTPEIKSRPQNNRVVQTGYAPALVDQATSDQVAVNEYGIVKADARILYGPIPYSFHVDYKSPAHGSS
jgi:hypothetical protein